MEQVLSYLTLFSLWGHMTKFIINAELIWLPWLALSDFSLGYICLHGENACCRAERLLPSSNTCGPVSVESRTYPDIRTGPTGFGGQQTTSWAKNGVGLFFPFSECWRRSSLLRICKSFRWGRGWISSSHSYFALTKDSSWSLSVTVKLS